MYKIIRRDYEDLNGCTAEKKALFRACGKTYDGHMIYHMVNEKGVKISDVQYCQVRKYYERGLIMLILCID